MKCCHVKRVELGTVSEIGQSYETDSQTHLIVEEVDGVFVELEGQGLEEGDVVG